MNKSLVLSIISVLLITSSIAQEVSTNNDWWLSIGELADKYGYEYEDTYVTSEDGYISKLHRIRGPLGQDNSNREPFYAVAPFATSEAVFFLHGPEQSQGFQIINAGYDFWFLSPRGSPSSRGHIDPDISEADYWRFDLVDICLDHIAALTYIEEVTGYPQVHADGFSSGGSSLGHAIAVYPDFFNAHLRSVHYLVGTMNFAHCTFYLFNWLVAVPGLLTTLEDFGFYALTNINFPQQMIQGLICQMFEEVCVRVADDLLQILDGDSDDYNAFSTFFFRGNAGYSTHLIAHYLQSLVTKKVTYFDYGEEGNLEAYGHAEPPRIQYENHRMPVAMYNAEGDTIADITDAQWFMDQIGDALVFFHEYPSSAHFSFGLRKDMYYLDDMFDIMSQYPIERTNQ